MDIIKEHKRNESLDYLKILKSLNEIPFPVGKNLLADFLSGDMKNKSIKKNNLYSLHNFNSLKKDKSEIIAIIDKLLQNNLIEQKSPPNNRFFKVLYLTSKGNQELINPQLYKKQVKNKYEHRETQITEQDRQIFSELSHFLDTFNDSQKKAIISNSKKILCIAGAGSGKTTVLTKRIEFLVKYKSIPENEILAITFTRKARKEMQSRLENLGVQTNIETFNSFSEKILQKYEMQIYGRKMSVMSYRDKIMAIMSALDHEGIDMEKAIYRYFKPKQRKNNPKEKLTNIFINDCFFILDYFKLKNLEIYDFSKEAEEKDKSKAKLIYNITKFLKQYMDIHSLRDYTDQVLDTINFFKENPEKIPQYNHVLVDEYQDVNSQQIQLLGLLNPENLFAVGDPRQSIFGWRGSDINYILDFNKKHEESETISLTKNYRSSKEIVNFMNKSIEKMQLPDLEHYNEHESKIKLLDFDSEAAEANFITKKILSSNIPKNEIFILARTNRQLTELSRHLRLRNIKHVVKTDEIRNPREANPDEITLATIHAIKGLEAKMVFVIGCNEQNFPCKASDHPVVELVKVDDYDKEEEERRLFYVAISRAKKELYLTHSGKKPTYFLTDDMIRMIREL